MTGVSVLQSLPAGMIAQIGNLRRFVNFGAVGAVVRVSAGGSAAAVKWAKAKGEEEFAEGVDAATVEMEESLHAGILERSVEGSGEGLSHNALLVMQKVKNVCGGTGWADWGDYDVLVPRLVRRLRETGRRIEVDVFYAERDGMIGGAGEGKGAKWFDGLWEGTGGVVGYRRRVLGGADHDSIWFVRWGGVQGVFGRILELGGVMGLGLGTQVIWVTEFTVMWMSLISHGNSAAPAVVSCQR